MVGARKGLLQGSSPLCYPYNKRTLVIKRTTVERVGKIFAAIRFSSNLREVNWKRGAEFLDRRGLVGRAARLFGSLKAPVTKYIWLSTICISLRQPPFSPHKHHKYYLTLVHIHKFVQFHSRVCFLLSQNFID